MRVQFSANMSGDGSLGLWRQRCLETALLACDDKYVRRRHFRPVTANKLGDGALGL